MDIENFENFNNSKISLNRKIINWEWYTEPNTFKLFIHCLLRANFKDEKYRGILVKRGQFITGRKKLSAETGLSERQIRTALLHLETTNELTKEKKGTYTVITINKYNEYQQNTSYKRPANDQRPTNDRPATDQRPTTNNNEIIMNNNEIIMSSRENSTNLSIDNNFLKEHSIKIYGEYQNVYLSDKDYGWLLARIPSEKVLNKYIEEVSTSLAEDTSGKFEFDFTETHIHIHRIRVYKFFQYAQKNRKAVKTEEKKEIVKVATMENYRPV